MNPTPARRSDCPIAVTLDILGDRWSLLIVRDLMFNRARTFSDLAKGGENIASNVLTERLERLAKSGIITSAPNAVDRRRRDYRLTDKGWLLGPALIEIVLWSAAHHETAAPAEVVAAMRADRDGFLRAARMAAEANDQEN